MNVKALVVVVTLTIVPVFYSSATATTWATDFCDAIMARHPGTVDDMTAKGWEYTNGIVYQGFERTYEYTKDAKYLAYIKKYVDKFVSSSGKVSFDESKKSLDKLHPAILCMFLYKETGEDKYKIAADHIFGLLKQQPTNASGGFWHKAANANHMLLDGIYMAQPLLARYGYQIGEQKYCNDMVAFQILLLAEHVYLKDSKLLLHGWDETKKAAWADKTTGVNTEVWSRAMGWFSMALVQVLRYFPEEHPKYNELVTLLQNIAEGIKNAQDPATGLWYQVVDKGGQAGNWLESSGSGMMVSALKEAVDYGFIDKSYLAVAQKGWAGFQTKLTRDSKGPVINDFAGSMNVLVDYNAYIAKEKEACPPAKHTHGYCASLMAAAAMELATKPKYRLTITTSGTGTVANPTKEMFHDSGAVVTLTAAPGAGQKVLWGGDASGGDLTTAIVMDGPKKITATFSDGTATKAAATQLRGTGVSLSRAGSKVSVTLDLNGAQAVRATVFSSNGKKVGTINAGYLAMGTHTIALNSQKYANGTYYVKVQLGAEVTTTLPFVIIND